MKGNANHTGQNSNSIVNEMLKVKNVKDVLRHLSMTEHINNIPSVSQKVLIIYALALLQILIIISSL